MEFQLIITIIIIIYLRKALAMRVSFPDWNQKLRWMMYAAIGLLVIHFVYRSADPVTQWGVLLLLSLLIYQIYENEIFNKVAFLVTAAVPYLVISAIIYLIKLISPAFYSDWKQWLEAANSFAIVWGFGIWFTTRRQRKELAKARERAIAEEENNKRISAMKAQLEVQVAERTQELTLQKDELELALKELKSTQSQLIQSEKMASLGELTAGIAHEIQNPLNFVNNFSEVSNELIQELKGERAKTTGERDSELENEILNDISQNLEKILHHGKRADAIVKGMLQHSRISSGQKELTDINALADEYLRLSFHGLRAKDKGFNADFKTDFDPSLSAGEAGIEKINIIPQDIGRVLLNLFNNAFYAVNERHRQACLPDRQAPPGISYEPTVAVSTFLKPPLEGREASVLITVSDNGNGIPQKVVDKIFQPFFTTKPTGEGTGLGLSISYDIIKAHGGEIKVESREGEGTKFIIQLPVT
ncbi:MAG: ATP-binding protein [Ginsengibacter sp.]